MLAEPTDRRITEALARAIAGIGSDQHVERMVDLIRELVPQDLVTVTRYSTTQRPEFVSHRNFSDAMVQRYLEIYYLHDPFFHFWRRHRRPGVVPLKSFAGPDVKRGRYVAEFLAHSVICDEVGVLLEDGPGWCLGIFLDRSKKAFSSAEIDQARRAVSGVCGAPRARYQVAPAGLHAHQPAAGGRPPARRQSAAAPVAGAQ